MAIDLAAAAEKPPTGHRGLEHFALMRLSGGEMDCDYETVAVADEIDLVPNPTRERPNAWSDGLAFAPSLARPIAGGCSVFFNDLTGS